MHQNLSKSADLVAVPSIFYLCRPQKMSQTSKIQNSKSKIQNPDSKIQNSPIQNPKSEIRNPKSKICTAKSKIQKSRIQNLTPNFGALGASHKELLHNDPKSKFPKFGRKSLDFGFGIGELWILDSGFWILGGPGDVPLGNSVTVPRDQRLESSLVRLNCLPVHLFLTHGGQP